jgi:hypothetical protein
MYGQFWIRTKLLPDLSQMQIRFLTVKTKTYKICLKTFTSWIILTAVKENMTIFLPMFFKKCGILSLGVEIRTFSQMQDQDPQPCYVPVRTVHNSYLLIQSRLAGTIKRINLPLFVSRIYVNYKLKLLISICIGSRIRYGTGSAHLSLS